MLRICLTGLLSVLIACFTVLTANGQVRVLIRINNQSDGSEQFEELMSNLKANCENRLAGQIRELKSCCDLTEEQIIKLQVAAKGAVGKFIDEERDEKEKQLERYQRQAGIDPDRDEDDDDNNQVVRSFNFVLQTKNPRGVEKSVRWTRSIDNELTNEQNKSYRKMLRERDKKLRATAIDHFMARVDLQLFLDDDQEVIMRDFLDQRHGDMLLNHLKTVDEIQSRSISATVGEPRHAKQLKEFLTEEQFGAWKHVIEPSLIGMQTDIARANR